jgi:flavorubredoxin
MKPRRIAEGVSWVGAVDWDRRLFDALIPLPDGTSYNSYLVEGTEKTALIETVDPEFTASLGEELSGVDRIDYVVANHGEQDHTGSLPLLLGRYPDAKVLATPKCRELILDELHLDPGRIDAVEDRAAVALGGKTLEFIHMPWVHWPDTMVTYLREDKVLFSCDLFGSHLASNELFVQEGDQPTGEERVYEAAKRYYAEIMMPFRKLIQKHLVKLDEVEIETICPSHGPVYSRPAFIIDAYREWASDTPKNVVVIPYVSMHDSTRQMVDHLVGALTERGIVVERFNLEDVDLGRLAMGLVDAATIVIGTPTVLTGAHPKVVYAAYLTNALRPKAKFGSIIGSYGWASRAVDQITDLISNLKLDLVEPVVIKGAPREEDYRSLDALADAIATKHKEAELL